MSFLPLLPHPLLGLAQTLVKLGWHKQLRGDLTQETALDMKQLCGTKGGTASFDSSVGLCALTYLLKNALRQGTQLDDMKSFLFLTLAEGSCFLICPTEREWRKLVRP